jgi:hypothetical protein
MRNRKTRKAGRGNHKRKKQRQKKNFRRTKRRE